MWCAHEYEETFAKVLLLDPKKLFASGNSRASAKSAETPQTSQQMASSADAPHSSGGASSATRLRIASDIGGVLLEGVKDASTTDGEDYGSHSSLLPGALDGLRGLTIDYDVWLLSYCGESMEAKTRAALRAFGIADIVPEERWRFTRTRPDKVVVMKAEGISLLIDDRGDIVGHCHANYLRAVLFRQEKNGGTGWPGIPQLVRAALPAAVPNPRIAFNAFQEERRRLRSGSDAAAPSAPATKPPKVAAAPVPEPDRRFVSRVSFLGTGSGLPTRMRGASATVLSFSDNAHWLFDCGEGTQVQFGRSSKDGKALAEALPGTSTAQGVSMGGLARIFITHLHGDHCFGLPGLILTLAAKWGVSNQGEDEQADAADGADDGETPTFRPFNHDTEFLEIVGPVGLAAFLRCCLVSSDSGYFGFRYRVSEILGPDDAEPVYPPAFSSDRHPSASLHCSEAAPRVLRPDSDGATTIAHGVFAARIDHRVTCYGFSVTEADRPGSLDAKRAAELGVKGKDLGLLKAGKDVTLADGRVVCSSECVLPSSPGRVFIHLGDCIDNSASARAARGSGPCPLIARASRERRTVALLVHEATFCDALAMDALKKGHCTARHAAAYAAEAGAELLCLTHISQRYLPRSHGPDAAAEIEALEAEARAELAARGAAACIVRCVEDFEAVSAPTRK